MFVGKTEHVWKIVGRFWAWQKVFVYFLFFFLFVCFIFFLEGLRVSWGGPKGHLLGPKPSLFVLVCFFWCLEKVCFPWKRGYFWSFFSVSLYFSLACLTSFFHSFSFSLLLFSCVFPSLFFLVCFLVFWFYFLACFCAFVFLHLKGCFHQYLFFSWFLVLFCLSNPLFLSLLFPLASAHLTIPLLRGFCVPWFCFCFSFV